MGLSIIICAGNGFILCDFEARHSCIKNSCLGQKNIFKS